MIALDTNVLVRYLVCDDPDQAAAAREALESLSGEAPGFVCREVAVELVWMLERAYRYSRDEIATALEDLTATEHVVVEASRDVARAAMQYREGSASFADLMLLSAAKRAGARTLCTFDRKTAKLDGATLLTAGEKQKTVAPGTPGARRQACD